MHQQQVYDTLEQFHIEDLNLMKSVYNLLISIVNMIEDYKLYILLHPSPEIIMQTWSEGVTVKFCKHRFSYTMTRT